MGTRPSVCDSAHCPSLRSLWVRRGSTPFRTTFESRSRWVTVADNHLLATEGFFGSPLRALTLRTSRSIATSLLSYRSRRAYLSICTA
jgi:hypothetical protein